MWFVSSHPWGLVYVDGDIYIYRCILVLQCAVYLTMDTCTFKRLFTASTHIDLLYTNYTLEDFEKTKVFIHTLYSQIKILPTKFFLRLFPIIICHHPLFNIITCLDHPLSHYTVHATVILSAIL